MLREYAVEPHAIGSDWNTFRYLIEKFGFDRGRLISRFPKRWLRDVYSASAGFTDLQRKYLEEMLAQAKKYKVVPSGRPYDPSLGGWLDNALAQHGVAPFHAIISEVNATGQEVVLKAADVDDLTPLMISPHTWEVARVGTVLADAISPMLRAARTLLFVDPYFDIREARYQETLQACLEIVQSNNAGGTRCEIHYRDHDTRPPPEIVERQAHRWLDGIIPDGMSIALFAWQEKAGGEDFHARYLLSDVGGIGVDAGFSAEGDHQKVLLGLLALDFAQAKMEDFERGSSVYDLVEPVLEIAADGRTRRL